MCMSEMGRQACSLRLELLHVYIYISLPGGSHTLPQECARTSSRYLFRYIIIRNVTLVDKQQKCPTANVYHSCLSAGIAGKSGQADNRMENHSE